jgi:hypothetical protein
MIAPWNNLSFFSPRILLFPRGKKGLSCSKEQLKFFFPEEQHVLEEELKLH